MSSEALAWAFSLDIKPSSLKFTLVAMCECANYKTGRITPSLSHLCEITGLDRKTIIASIADLAELGLITDTGERCGKTGQIKVYNAAIETVPKAERFRKRNSTVFSAKEYRKRNTEPSREPSFNGSNTRARGIHKPDGVSEQVWSDFVAHRKRLKADITETAMQGILREADKARWPLENVLVEMVSRGWRGFKAEWVQENGKRNSNDRGASGADLAARALQKLGNHG